MYLARPKTIMAWIYRSISVAILALPIAAHAQEQADVVVYGATPAGIMASVAAARQGQKVLLIEPSSLVGGVVAGGLTKTDIGRRDTVGGLPNEFFSRVLAYYEKTYGKNSSQAQECHGGIFFEPHVAEGVFNDMLREAGVRILKKERVIDVDVERDHISRVRIQSTSGNAVTQVAGKVFIDASYEGDLMALAGVPYRVGREAVAEYGESLAGVTRGLPEYIGSGDHRLQSFNIRSTLTNRDDIRLPVPKPEHYTPEVFADFLTHIREKHLQTFNDLFPDVPEWGPVNGKSDPNKADDIGANIDYADGIFETRQRSYEHTRDLWLTFWYMLQNDPSLSPEFRESARKWGLPKDEFVETNHVTPQLYVREARRMLGRYIMTQRDVQTDRLKEDGVALGSYGIDSHPVQTVLTPNGMVEEGGNIAGWTDPYNIPYRSLTPIAPSNLLVVVDISATHIAYCTVRMEPVFMMLGQAGGLAADLAIMGRTSVQEISVTKLREELKSAGVPLEPLFRPVVAIAVDSSADPGKAVQFHGVQKEVRAPLTKYYWNFDGSGVVQSTDADASWTFPVAKPWLVSLFVEDANGNRSLVSRRTLNVGSGGPKDVTLSFESAVDNGLWDRVTGASLDERELVAYHDLNKDKGMKSVTFTATLPVTGRYRVAMAFPQGAKRATNVPVKITSGSDEHALHINQRSKATPYAFVPIGDFSFEADKPVTLSVGTQGTDGDVAIEAVRWIWVGVK